jgi:periplasmic divalent cation tolerance protein
MKTNIISIYVTHSNQAEAEKITSYLLNKHLIARTNFFPIKSTYWWKGKLETTDEIVTLLKTKEENFEIVRDEILKIHPYETPCILKIEMEANESYGQWIHGETSV